MSSTLEPITFKSAFRDAIFGGGACGTVERLSQLALGIICSSSTCIPSIHGGTIYDAHPNISRCLWYGGVIVSAHATFHLSKRVRVLSAWLPHANNHHMRSRRLFQHV